MTPTPKDDHNMVNNITFRNRIIDAVQSNGSSGCIVDDLIIAEPAMMTVISEFTNDLSETIDEYHDVFFHSSDNHKIPQETKSDLHQFSQDNAKLQKLLLWLFSIGFKTGGETMREFYKEALDDSIEFPHEDYEKKDFE